MPGSVDGAALNAAATLLEQLGFEPTSISLRWTTNEYLRSKTVDVQFAGGHPRTVSGSLLITIIKPDTSEASSASSATSEYSVPVQLPSLLRPALTYRIRQLVKRWAETL